MNYVGLLTNGTHTIDIVSIDGIATCTFVVNYPDCEHNFYDNQCTKCQRYNCAINTNHLDEVTSWYEQYEDGFCDICNLHLCAFTNKHFDFWSDMGENSDNYCDGCGSEVIGDGSNDCAHIYDENNHCCATCGMWFCYDDDSDLQCDTCGRYMN